MPTPCIGICQLDDNNICVGCGRTLQEIRGWSKLSSEEQEIQIKQIQERKQND